MAVIHIGTEITLAAVSKDDISNGDVAYAWIDSFSRKMIYDSTATYETNVTEHRFYVRPNDYAGAGVWIEDVGADQPEAWSADQIRTGQLQSINWAAAAGSSYDLDLSKLVLGGSNVDAVGSAAGVFIGLDSGEYKLYVGDGANKYLKFDATDFTLNLTNLVIDSATQSIRLNKSGYTDDTTGAWLGLNSGDYKFYVGKDTAHLKYDPTNGVQVRGNISASTITGGSIVGAYIATASSGRRMVMTTEGIQLITTDVTGKYGSFVYGDGVTYGTGVRAWIWNSVFNVPFYIVSGSTNADFHFYNRVANPSGESEEGDVCVVSETLKLCTAAGTPGTWKSLAMEAGGTGGSGSAGAGNQYVELEIDGVVYKLLHDGIV